jgi:pSer/pThr/pTyr-binding forkhead associated (FHA) protein
MEVRLVVERGADSGHTFRMRAPEMLIGRKKGCGLRIPSAAVSREHCRLELVEGFLTVVPFPEMTVPLVHPQVW